MTSAKMTWKKLTIIASLLTATALVCIPALGQSKTQPVLVVNGSAQPVPTAAQGTTNVAGTVNIGNAPSVNVANTPTVNLAAGGSVNVANPPNGQNNPTPLAVLEATQPYEDGCVFNFSGSNLGDCVFHAIPSGKRLVIQEFDAQGVVLSGVKPIDIEVTLGSSLAHYFTTTFMGGTNDVDFFATHQETHLYAASNVTPVCSADLNANSSGYYRCQFSGFLVDVPR